MNATLLQRLDIENSETARQTLITAYLQPQIAKIAGVELAQMDCQQPLSYLGFDSLMATELRNQLLTDLGADISLQTILEESTIASLVEQIQAQLTESRRSASSQPLSTALSPEVGRFPSPGIGCHPSPDTGSYPLSQGQWGLWFLYKLAPESATYNIAFTARVHSTLSVAALKQSVQILVERYPTLRTTYGQETAEPFQEIHAAQAFDADQLFEQIDASGWDEETLVKEAIAAYQRPFNLESGPILRLTILTQAAQSHVLLLTIHHIAVDSVSFGVLLEELKQLYPLVQAGRRVALKPIDYSYTDFVQWQRELLNSAAGKTLWAYWKQRLQDAPTLILPVDHPRQSTQTHRGASCSFEISAALTAQLRTLAKTTGATLYTTLLTVFQILLYRYTGQTDMVVGTPASGRSQAQFARTVGFFVNMIVLRTDLSGDPTFTALLAQVRQTVLEALEHQAYPAPLVVEKLGMNRDLSLPGLFRASFNLLNLPKLAGDFELSVSNQIDARTRWGDLALEPFEIPQQEGQNDLVFDIMETSTRLIGIFRYNCDLFEASTIHRMAGHFLTLLEGIVVNPNQPISRLPFLTAPEQQRLLAWGAPTADYPTGLCIHQLIERQAERTPNAIALVCPENSLESDPDDESLTFQQLTYRQLNLQSNQLARCLQTRGVGGEVRVGIYLERSPTLLIAVLGVLKAGGAYVPLDPNYPSERLSFMLADTQAALLLTDTSLLETLPQSDAPRLCLDQIQAELSQQKNTNLVGSVDPEQLAYIVYTSGSTGRAKGVMIEHRSLVNAYFAWEDAYQLPTLSSHLQMASFSFDVFAGDFVRALSSGSKLVICPQDWLLEPERLYGLMKAQAVDTAEFGPAVVRTLMQYLRQTGQMLDFMRLLVVGSDAFYIQEYEQLKRLCSPETWLINSYGVSEATIDSSYFETTAFTLSSEGMAPIGRPFPNTQLWVLDDHLQLVPEGVAGELYIGGAGLARGYLNRPELTQERFIPNPFVGDRGQGTGDRGWEDIQNPKSKIQNPKSNRLYKTGDLVRYLSDGNLEYLGRSDSQVKLRGYRIELGEIEATLAQHPAVWQSVVTVREDRLGIKSLVAYVVFESEQGVSPAELRAFLSQQLPAPMLPSGFVLLDAFPLNANGKVDRRALPLPDVFERGLGEGFTPPRNRIEKRLAKIWADLLRLDSVGVHDNFFELGGHSLLATQAIAQMRQAFQIKLPLRLLFDTPTIAQMGEQIEASYHQQQLDSIPAITRLPPIRRSYRFPSPRRVCGFLTS